MSAPSTPAPSTRRPFAGRPIIAVIRDDDRAVAGRIAAAAAAVLPVVEVTYTVPDASGLIAELLELRHARDGDTLIGAGTVRNAATARDAIAAGASFLVAPDFDADVAAIAADAGIAYVPGAFTPTEIATAARHGAGTVKLFPAASLGTDFLTAVRAVAPDLAFVPTGGVGAVNAREWFAAGAHAVGVGSSLGRAYRSGGVPAVEAEATALAALATLAEPANPTSPTNPTSSHGATS